MRKEDHYERNDKMQQDPSLYWFIFIGRNYGTAAFFLREKTG